MIETVTNLLVGEDNEEDIKRYGRLIALFGVGIIANSVRASVIIPTDNLPVPINIYATAFASSGVGKSKSLKYMMNWIEDAWNDVRTKANAALEIADPMGLEEISELTSDGVSVAPTYKSITDSALTALNRVLDITGYGNVNLIIDEYASSITREYELLSTSILEVYDNGKIPVNLRKTSRVAPAENPVPFNLLAFGSSHLLFESDDNTEKQFMALLQAGMARRSLFVNVDTAVNKYLLDISVNGNEAKIEKVKDDFRRIVEKYDHREMSLDSEAKELYMSYHNDNIDESSALSEYKQLDKIYARSKYWLALKLSGLIAISHLHDCVTVDDLQEAIDIVEESQKDFYSILNRREKYEIVVDYLSEVGTSHSEYDLTKNLPFYKEIKGKTAFVNLMKGYAYSNNIALQIEDRRNVTFYTAKQKEKVDLDKPLMFSYSGNITEDYFTNDSILWKDFYKVVTSDKACYSAHSFKGGYRSNDNAIEGFSLVILDIDGGTPLETAKILFEDYTYLIATTKSHQKEKNGVVEDRFRVILPMEYSLELDSESFSKFMKNVFEDLPIEVDELADRARFFYGSSGEYWYNEGLLFNGDKYIPNTSEEEQYVKQGKTLAKKNLSGISSYIVRNQYSGRNKALTKLALLLMDSGYTHDECKAEVKKVNNNFDNPLSVNELEKTIFKTVSKREEKVVEDEDVYYDNTSEDEDPFNTI